MYSICTSFGIDFRAIYYPPPRTSTPLSYIVQNIGQAKAFVGKRGGGGEGDDMLLKKC